MSEELSRFSHKFDLNCDDLPIEVIVYVRGDTHLMSLVDCKYNTGGHGEYCNLSGNECPYSFVTGVRKLRL